MQIEWNALSADDWHAAFGPAPVPLQQSWAYGAVAERLGRQVARARIFQAGRPVGLAQVIVAPGRFGARALLTRGPVLTGGGPAGILTALRRSLPARGPKVLIATPERAGGGGVPLMTAAHIAELDLTPNEEALRAGLAGKWRNRLVASGRAGLTITEEHDLEPLLRKEAAQRQHRGYGALPAAFTRAWAEQAPEGWRLYVARRKGRMLAAMLFLLHAPGASYHIGWSGEEGRAASAHNALMWHAICALRRRGITRLDLGALNTEDTPGLARFKLGTGAKARALAPTVLSLPGSGGWVTPAMAATARWRERPPAPRWSPHRR